MALFLGGVDTGKSTLIRRLHELIGGEVIDADLGQSGLGPPACVSRGDYHQVKGSYFVGDISPRGNFAQLLSAIRQAIDSTQGPCLIDTDGYVFGEPARILKGELINLARPDVLVLLQRQRELDYFKLFARKGIEVVDLRVSHPGWKSREERIRAREEAFRRCFQQAKPRRWKMGEIRFERSPIGHGEPVNLGSLEKMLDCRVLGSWRMGEELAVIIDGYARALEMVKGFFHVSYIHLVNLSSLRNLLISCLSGGKLRGLGILKELDGEWIEVLTPVEKATVLQMGRLVVGEDGRHHRLSFPIRPTGSPGRSPGSPPSRSRSSPR